MLKLKLKASRESLIDSYWDDRAMGDGLYCGVVSHFGERNKPKGGVNAGFGPYTSPAVPFPFWGTCKDHVTGLQVAVRRQVSHDLGHAGGSIETSQIAAWSHR